MTAARRNRQLHRWGAAIVALPFLIIVVSGFLLQLKSSFFHDRAKLLVWLPVALILFGLWCTGLYLWLQPHLARRRKRERRPA